MASAREKIPQLGLWDDEVVKPTHDKMVMWAYSNAESIVRSYLKAFPKSDYYSASSSAWTPNSIKIPRHADINDLPSLPTKPVNLVANISIEKVIQQYPNNSRGMPKILGYADLTIDWFVPQVEWGDDKQWHIYGRNDSLLVEVKTILPTLGELMRQINLYRIAYHNVVVIAPDASYEDILKEQGILFIKYAES